MMNMDSARGGDFLEMPEGWKAKKSKPKYAEQETYSENDNPFPADWRVPQSKKNRMNGNDDPPEQTSEYEEDDEEADPKEPPSKKGEKWKYVLGPYEVSNLGRIRRNNKILKPRISSRGFAYLHASYEGKVEQPSYHSLVMKAFGPRPPKGSKKPLIMHKDNNKLNNSIKNLAWGSTAKNTSDAYDDGLIEGKGSNNSEWKKKNGPNGEKKQAPEE